MGGAPERTGGDRDGAAGDGDVRGGDGVRDGDGVRSGEREDAAGGAPAREAEAEAGHGGRDGGAGSRDRATGGGDGDGEDGGGGGGPVGKPSVLGGSVVFAPGVGPRPRGPRDYELADPDEAAEGGTGGGPRRGGADDDGEGHFVPPEPPPLPEADPAVKFGWLGVAGGPVLMLLAVLLQWDMTWWLTTLCVGGFLGGFAMLVGRMRPGDEEDDDDPGRGAVV
ncbi:hypothetical protein [Streptomyces fradiae]|uniref:hypothetical protein n=1 Tax=Streptomyces fradiae TaxID=1906 RepID=UPI00365B8A81